MSDLCVKCNRAVGMLMRITRKTALPSGLLRPSKVELKRIENDHAVAGSGSSEGNVFLRFSACRSRSLVKSLGLLIFKQRFAYL